MYAVTGASGQLGRHVLDALLSKVKPTEITALARDPSRLEAYSKRGVIVRSFDYDEPDGLAPALDGVDRLLLVSGDSLGVRVSQHRAVIDASKAAGVNFLAYTSLLHADTSRLGLALDHRVTEDVITKSGLAYAFLRNGWYIENYTRSAAKEAAMGTVYGCTGDGRISAAACADYAEAAATVLLDDTVSNRILELAGDDGVTLSDYASLLADESGRPVSYVHMEEVDYARALEQVGLPAARAAILAESSATAAQGILFDDSRTLSTIIGRPTTPLRRIIIAALR